jgi:hypothetical protein
MARQLRPEAADSRFESPVAIEGDLDVEMVAVARAIIRQRTGTFDPSNRYQEALRELIEAKLKGLPITPRGHHAATGDRSDGGPETQSRTGNACNQRHDRQAKASQARNGSSPAVIASTRSRRSKKEGGGRDRAGRHHPEAAKEGLSAAIKHFLRGGSRWLY